jgi:serine/threonine-protein kinase
MPNDHKTKSGVALGTLPYMAPEQALGRRSEIDGRVDVFAVGATMFRILSGRRIHVADSEAELLMAMASRPAPALSSVAPELQRDLCAVVDLALAFSREARYPDARTMQTDVRALRQGAPPPFARARLAARDQATRVDVAAPSPERVPQRTQPLEAMPMSRGATMPLHAFQGTLPGGAPPPNALIHTGAEDIPASNRAPHSSRTEKLAVHKPADVGSPTSAPATAVGYGVSSPAQGERPRRSLLLVALVGVFFLMIGAAAAFVFLREDAGGDAALEANAPLPAPEADPVAAAAPGPTTARADAVAAAKVAEAAPKKGTDVTAGKANADDPAKPGVPAETAAKDTTAAPDATPIASAASAAPAAAKAAEAAPAETGTNLLAPPPAPTTKPPPPPKGKSKRKKDH